MTRLVSMLRTKPVSRRKFLAGSGAAAGALAMPSLIPSRASAQSPLVWYTGSQIDAVSDWVELFRERTGIVCDFYRAGGLAIAQRFEEEVRANQVQCSLVGSSLVGLVRDWADRGLLLEYDGPEYANFRDDMVIGRHAAPNKIDVIAMAYNTEMISEEEAPKTWEDILDPRWRGQMVLADASASTGALHWFAAMRQSYGREFMEQLAQQDVLVRTGNGEVVNTLISGERPLSCMVYQYHVDAAISNGANLRVLIPDDGAPVAMSYIAITRDAPNPEDARKFLDFAMGHEAQTLWRDKYFAASARIDVPGSDTMSVNIDTLTAISSTPEDHIAFFEDNASISDDWVDLFRS